MSNFIDKLERKFGRFAIPNLMFYVSILYVIGFIVVKINPMLYFLYFSLDVEAILHGEVWRLVTFLMLPPNTNILMLVISIYFYTFLGRTLENIWGTFKFNLYYFTGIILTIIAAFIAYFISPASYWLIGTYYLNISMFMAFAVNVPDMRVLFMFLIPIRVRWLAYLDAAILLYSLVAAFRGGDYGTCLAIVVAFVNFFIFFFGFMRRHYSPRQFMRRQQFKRAMNRGYQQNGYTGGYAGAGPSFGQTPNSNNKKITRHRCAICGRSELDGDTLEFRFCSKCNGNYEYCQDHLFTHTHVQ